MPIDGYMAFMNYPNRSPLYLKSESQVLWDDTSTLGTQSNFINFKEASQKPNLGLFEIEEWGFGVERVLTTASQSGGIGTGSATFNPFSITRRIDQASPLLFQMSCSGATFKRVSLLLRKGTGDANSGQTYLRYDFRLVGVKTVNWSHAEDTPTETVEFEYGAVTMQYAPQNPDGSFLTPIPGGWNRITNRQDITNEDISNKVA